MSEARFSIEEFNQILGGELWSKQDEIFNLLKKAPANTSSSYGKPFIETFKAANYDFYAIDPGLFAPAVYTVTNVKTGKSITVGEINHTLLKESYELS